MTSHKTFRDCLWDLYLLCCQRKGWKPERSMAAFEREALVSEDTFRKIFKGPNTTNEKRIIDTLLDGLYNGGEDGVLSSEERDWWKEELYTSFSNDKIRQLLTSKVNPEVEDLPDDIINDFVQKLRGYYRQTGNGFGFDIMTTALANRWLSGKSAHLKTHRDNFLTSGNEWVKYYESKGTEFRSSSYSSYTLFNLGGYTKLQFPASNNFIASTHVKKHKADSLRACGIILFLQKKTSSLQNITPAKNPEIVVRFIVAPSARHGYIRSHDIANKFTWLNASSERKLVEPEQPCFLSVECNGDEYRFFINSDLAHKEKYIHGDPNRKWSDYITQCGLCYSPGLENSNAIQPPLTISDLGSFYDYYEFVTFD